MSLSLAALKRAINDSESVANLKSLISTGSLEQIKPLDEVISYCIKRGSAEKFDILLNNIQIQAISAEIFFELMNRACFEVIDSPGSQEAQAWKALVNQLLPLAEDVNYIKTFKGSVDGKACLDIVTPLKSSILMNDVQLTQKLIEKGAQLNLCYNDDQVQGGNLLHLVCHRNLMVELAEILLKYKIETDIKDNNGKPPLYWAAKNKNLTLMQLLIQNGASVNEKTGRNDDNTLLIELISEENYIAANLLIEYGADINYTNQYGWNATRLAFVRNNRELGEKLISKGARVIPYIGIGGNPCETGGVCVEFLDDSAAGSAYNAGIKIGDIILTVDQIEVNNALEITSILLKHRPLDKIPVKVQRQDELIEIWVEIQTRAG